MVLFSSKCFFEGMYSQSKYQVYVVYFSIKHSIVRIISIDSVRRYIVLIKRNCDWIEHIQLGQLNKWNKIRDWERARGRELRAERHACSDNQEQFKYSEERNLNSSCGIYWYGCGCLNVMWDTDSNAEPFYRINFVCLRSSLTVGVCSLDSRRKYLRCRQTTATD